MPPTIQTTSLPGVLKVTGNVFRDARGSFAELYQARDYSALGIDTVFLQDNLSRSAKGVLRGLHYQLPDPQGKLVAAIRGTIWDVVVDIRRGSPHFGRWVGVELSDANCVQLYIPPGFAHGFCALSDDAHVFYKCTELYNAQADRGIRWDDPDLGIEWPVSDPVVSDKDRGLPALQEVPEESLPDVEDDAQA